MPRGRLITLEGGEGAGKSTQAQMLMQWLESQGVKAILSREPGGSDGAEAIRALLLSQEGDGWGARAEALLFAAARSDHVERLIRPALEAGTWVICDRFIDSSRAYQGGAGELGDDAIMALHNFGSQGLLPDLTLLLMVDDASAQARLKLRDGDASDRIGARPASYHAGVAASFRELARQEPERFVELDAARDRHSVHEDIIRALTPLIEQHKSGAG